MALDSGSFTDELTHKMGPLPAWAWGIGAAGVIYLVQRRRAASAAPVPNAGTADPSADALTPAYDASFGSVLAQSGYGSAGGQSIPVPLTSDQFSVMLADYLAGHGFTPDEVAAATPVVAGPPPEPGADASVPATTDYGSSQLMPETAAAFQNMGGTTASGAGYQVGGNLVYVPANIAENYASDLALVSNPYLNPELHNSAFSRLHAAGVL